MVNHLIEQSSRFFKQLLLHLGLFGMMFQIVIGKTDFFIRKVFFETAFLKKRAYF